MDIINFLSSNPLLLLFLIIGIGYAIGSIKISGFSLGPAAVLFVGIALGAVDKRIDLPEYIYILGLILFVYAIGIQSGPSFFASFRSRGLKFNILTAVIIVMSGIITIIIWKSMSLPAPSAVGLFCGSLTNTPALAATVEAIKSQTHNLTKESADLLANSPVVTYGLTYPFGVFGVIFAFFIFSKIFKVNFKADISHDEAGKIHIKTFKIINPGIFNIKLVDALNFIEHRNFVVSRIKQGNHVSISKPETILHENDLIVVVGSEEDLTKAHILFGEEMKENIPLFPGNAPEDIFLYHRVFVSNPDVVGKTLMQLDIETLIDATITRIRRGDVDFVPTYNTVIELGDQIRLVTKPNNIPRATKFFGDSMKSLSETDFLSLSLGIVMGVVLGLIPIPLPNGTTFKLGFAGGPLIAGLILGRIGHTKFITWRMPYTANLLLRHIGLVLFQAAIGVKAGHGFAQTFQTGGWGLIGAGALITTIAACTTIIIGYKVLKIPMSAVVGLMSGLQTQPSCLVYANQLTQNEYPNLWYATVYPTAMIVKIILAQLLITTLMMW